MRRCRDTEGKFLPKDDRDRAQTISWLMWQMVRSWARRAAAARYTCHTFHATLYALAAWQQACSAALHAVVPCGHCVFLHSQ